MSRPSSARKVKSGAGASTSTIDPSRRAVGVVRVSRVGEREGETFVSPREQRQRIEDACARDGLELVDVLEEPNVSGGAPLSRRPKLRQAIAMIENREANVVVVAYFDRLVRSVSVQAEIVDRVERAGGRILAVDIGEIAADTASRWLSSTLLGAVSEYHRRVTSERTADAKRRAVARGVPPFPRVPPGYARLADGRLTPNDDAPVVAQAFAMRANGSTIREVREHLRQHGIQRSYHGTMALLGSRVVLGELRFGALVNTSSHDPIVDADVWRRVQKIAVPRGRRPKSDRLLARAGVLRCGTCGSRMVVGTTRQGGTAYPFYRCPPTGDCPRRVTVSAEVAERVVVDEIRRLLAGVSASAAIDDGIASADADVERAEAELDAAVRAFTGLEDVDAARERLLELREQRDAARQRLDELTAAAVPAQTVTIDDWDALTLDEQRDIVRLVVAYAEVVPGRGDDRVRVYPRQ